MRLHVYTLYKAHDDVMILRVVKYVLWVTGDPKSGPTRVIVMPRDNSPFLKIPSGITVVPSIVDHGDDSVYNGFNMCLTFFEKLTNLPGRLLTRVLQFEQPVKTESGNSYLPPIHPSHPSHPINPSHRTLEASRSSNRVARLDVPAATRIRNSEPSGYTHRSSDGGSATGSAKGSARTTNERRLEPIVSNLQKYRSYNACDI